MVIFKACGKRKFSWIAINTNFGSMYCGWWDGKNDDYLYTKDCPALIPEFDYLVTKEKLEEGDSLFADYVNPTTNCHHESDC